MTAPGDAALLWRAAVVVSMLVALGVPPAAGQAAAPPGMAAAPNRGSYLQRAEAELDGWRMRLDGMEDKAEATGQAAATAAEADLRTAWVRTEAGARNLRTATAAEWDEARSSYEQASRDLQRAWDKSRL